MRHLWRAVLPAVVLAASCGGGAAAAERVAAAPARTLGEAAAKVSQRLVVTSAGDEPDPAVLTAEGAVDFANRRGSLSVAGGGTEFTTLFQGTTVYEHLPEVAGAAGKEWLRTDLHDLDVASDRASDVVRLQTPDPAVAVHLLRGAGAVRKVGREQIRGAATTWYDTTVDVAAAAAAAPAEHREAIDRLRGTFAVTRVPVDVWLDGDGRVRRLKQTIDYSAAVRSGRFPAGALPERLVATLELYDFGHPVRVTFPPPADVADYADVVGRAERGEGSGTASPDTDALVARLLTSLPEGYEQQPDNVGDTGPSDFEKAVRDDGGADAREVLETDGFVAGYQRLWTRTTEGTIIEFVYRFRAPTGAAHYLERTLASFTGEPDATEFPVPDVPGARGVRVPEDDELTAVVFVARGPYLGQVVVIGPDAGTDLPLRLARQQYDLLG